MDQNNPLSDPDPPADYGWGDNSYATTGKILMITIVVILFVVASMMLLHLYARWYLLRARRRQLRLARRTHFVFRFENGGNHQHPAAQVGLDPDVIRSLPVFVHSPGTNPDPVECAVCLSEFDEGETGRILPKCSHCFHVECIDMWFHSHSTCPLCRSPVELPVDPDPVEPGSSCDPRKCVGITLEVPSMRFGSGLDDDSVGSTPTQFRSPIGRMLSFTRMLSRERRTESLSPSSSVASGGGYLPEVDIERGKDETGPVG